MATAAEMVTSIETTLAQLYTKLHRSMSQKDRSSTLQDVAALEKSRDYWVGIRDRSAGTVSRVASIDLTDF
jgi:uncharacterized protein YecT (DUF1311 family)